MNATRTEIKMVDLKGQYLQIKEEIDNAIQKVLNNTSFINGSEVGEFCESLERYLDINHVIPCGNGTDALQLAMMTLNLKSGDEVIVPSHTYVATAEVLPILGLKPVFVDVSPDFFTLDVDKIEKKITAKTVAIIPVHLYGLCADMEPIVEIANENGLFVIEDNAQAIGAEYTFSDGRAKKAGTIGDIGTLSFFPSKNLGCYGDGGAVLFKEEELAKKCRMLANHGQSKKYKHDLIGINSRLDTIQAAILKVKLKYLNDYCNRRRQVAQNYSDGLVNINEIKLPEIPSYSTHVFHQYTIKLRSKELRDNLKNYLADNGIPSVIYYPIPLHQQDAYRVNGEEFPVTEKLSDTVLSLPIHTEMDTSTQDYIIETISKFFKS